jgi:aryl-alcohol dehydrogenase-like predicted oxidoreductase
MKVSPSSIWPPNTGKGKEEAFVGDALGDRRNSVVIATKFGQRELLYLDSDGIPHMSSDETRQGTSRRGSSSRSRKA